MVDISPNHWMLHLENNMKLSEISLPGTHNTCAHNCNLFAKCQSLSLEKQLNIGVRFIDIRCRHKNDQFTIYHGVVNLNLDFGDDVRDVCLNFLRNNPSEVIVMLISPEYKAKQNSKSFEEVFYSYIKDSSQFWYLENRIPGISEVRGKIVLLRRFYATNRQLGIDMSGWRFDDEFTIQNHHEFKFLVQDKHSLSRADKWKQISEFINANYSVMESNAWFLNYCSSTSFPFYMPIFNASKVNRKMKDYLQGIKRFYRLKGTFILDFASPPLVYAIFALNFVS